MLVANQNLTNLAGYVIFSMCEKYRTLSLPLFSSRADVRLVARLEHDLLGSLASIPCVCAQVLYLALHDRMVDFGIQHSLKLTHVVPVSPGAESPANLALGFPLYSIRAQSLLTTRRCRIERKQTHLRTSVRRPPQG